MFSIHNEITISNVTMVTYTGNITSVDVVLFC